MEPNNWIILVAGLLVGGGGAAGFLQPFFTRSRDRMAQSATDAQFGLSVLKETVVTLRADKVEQAQEIKDLKADKVEQAQEIKDLKAALAAAQQPKGRGR